MANKSPDQIVKDVEAALSNSQPCPYCFMFDGTHTVSCEYLKHKGNVDAKRTRGKAVEVTAKEEIAEIKEEATPTVETQELLEKMKPKE